MSLLRSEPESRSARGPSRVVGPAEGRALVVADAGWYSTESLFAEVDRPGVSTLMLKCLDMVNARNAGIPPGEWFGGRAEQAGPNRWKRRLILPPGWMKRFPTLGMRPIKRAVDQWRRSLPDDLPLTLVMTYPHYRYLRDLIKPDVQVYLNLDDYALYWPAEAEEVNRLERQLVAEADLTACVSQFRADQLIAEVPGAADRILHLPHGTPGHFLAEGPSRRAGPLPDDLDHLPRPVLGYVGGLEDRVDWRLLTRVAEEFPGASVVLIGKEPGGRSGDWFDEARRCLAMPNVHAVGFRPQESLGAYVRGFDACLIPYRADHPFNRACCPTKIMDFMGSGRPIIATDLPECRLYSGLIDVTTDADDFLGAIASLCFLHFDDGKQEARLELARDRSCARMAGRLLEAIDRAGESGGLGP